MDILAKIADAKRMEIKAAERVGYYNPFLSVRQTCAPAHLSFRQSILDSTTGIIAEFKRSSPSKGMINAMADPLEVVPGYALSGAAACSVLTNTRFFSGSIDDFMLARSSSTIPLLRKEFIVSELQIFESAAIGANAILLIAAILSLDEICRFTYVAHSLGMEVLLEVHSRPDFDKIIPDVDMIGINNRDLTNFKTDIANSSRLVSMLPAGAVKIAESGISSVKEIEVLRKAGFNGFLIGERFMREKTPGLALQNFLKGNA